MMTIRVNSWSTLFILISCIRSGWGQASKYEEPVCANAVPAPNLKAAWISKIPAWYVPMASNYYYHDWMEKLTNVTSNPNKMNTLCLKLLFLAPAKPNSPYVVVAGGLGKSVAYKCTTKGPHQQECQGVPGSKGYTPGTEVKEIAAMTDNTHFVLMAQCVKDKLKSFYVMTPTTNDIAKDVQKTLADFVKTLGFDLKLVGLLNYAGCPKPKA